MVHQIQPQPYRHPDLIGGRCMVSSVVEPDELKAPLRLDVLIGSSPSDVDDACTHLLRLCHRRCQYLANYVGSPPPITPAQLVLVIPFATRADDSIRKLIP